MTKPVSSAQTDSRRSLRIAGILVAAMWFLAMIVTDGIQKGTTRNIITSTAAAQHTVQAHQLDIVVESMGSFYLAALLIVFAAVLRHALGDAVSATVAFGSAVLASCAIVLGAVVSFAELAAAHHHDATALATLGYLVAFAWTWEGATAGFFLLATGWAVLSAHTAPRWFAIATLVLGVAAVVGFGDILFWGLAPIWFVLAGFLVAPRRDVRPDQVAETDASAPVPAR